MLSSASELFEANARKPNKMYPIWLIEVKARNFLKLNSFKARKVPTKMDPKAQTNIQSALELIIRYAGNTK